MNKQTHTKRYLNNILLVQIYSIHCILRDLITLPLVTSLLVESLSIHHIHPFGGAYRSPSAIEETYPWVRFLHTKAPGKLLQIIRMAGGAPGCLPEEDGAGQLLGKW